MQPLPHGYTNDSRTDGTVVVKRYVGFGRERRRETERSMLERLPAGLPVPRLLPSAGDDLVMTHLPGVPGQVLISAGFAGFVLRACGELLRKLELLDVYAGSGALVHGDFGPNNMLLDPDSFAVTGLVDWEWAHPGDPIEDLAWCEWIIRMHHPEAVAELGQLFAGYGSRPPWPQRQAAMVARCHELTAYAADVWREREATARSWTE